MRLLITGGRNYPDAYAVCEVLNIIKPTVLIVGDCPTGADKYARDWAMFQDFSPVLKVYTADWAKEGKAAGPLRNLRMIEEGSPWLCVAFPGGRGTADCINKCKAAGIPVLEYANERI